MEFEVAAISGFSAMLLDELDGLEESAAPVALEDSVAPDVLDASKDDASKESIGASGGAAEEQATNKIEEKMIRTSALQTIAKPPFMQSVTKSAV